MSQQEGEYRVGRGKPPLHTRFRKGRSGNPKGPRKKDLPALLLAALNETVTVDKDGRRRRISKREAIVEGLVDKSAGADLSATKLLIDLLKDIEKKLAPPPDRGLETRPLLRSDAAIVENLVARLLRTYRAELLALQLRHPFRHRLLDALQPLALAHRTPAGGVGAHLGSVNCQLIQNGPAFRRSARSRSGSAADPTRPHARAETRPADRG